MLGILVKAAEFRNILTVSYRHCRQIIHIYLLGIGTVKELKSSSELR